MQNTGLDEAQAGIKTARRNINNLRYADDTTLMTENKERDTTLQPKEKYEIISKCQRCGGNATFMHCSGSENWYSL